MGASCSKASRDYRPSEHLATWRVIGQEMRIDGQTWRTRTGLDLRPIPRKAPLYAGFLAATFFKRGVYGARLSTEVFATGIYLVFGIETNP